MVITIFSAPNYCDVYNNKGAVIKFKVCILFDSRIMILTFNNTIIVNILIYYLISWIFLLGLFLLLQKKVTLQSIIIVTEVLFHII